VGAALTWKWGVAGVTVAVLINFLIHLIVIAFLARKLMREKSDKPLAGPVPPLSELNAMMQE
jgi:Na+-driven multidrug efflux pump